ncbi:MAG: PAS domain S-box protein, partial [Anaerolineae bacterium]|nr:PAS domain S-box protein [Anaerolineae bacterium]
MTTGEWLHPVLEKMPDGVAVVVNGKIVYSNTPLSDMLHLRHDFIQGKPIVEIFHPKEIDLSLERMEDVITGGPEYSSEAQLISREGKTIPVEFFTRKLNYESETIGLLCVFRDLTVDKRIEDALGEVEARYHTLVEHAPEAILVYDANTHRFVDANEKALWLFGRDRQSIMEVGFDEVSEPLPSDQHTVQEFLADKIEKTLQGDVMDFEWTCINSSGKQVPCEVRLVQLPVKGRSLIRASLTDITGRKAAENALRESEERYALSARGANDGLWDWDLIADEIHYSPRWKEMLGYKDDEIGRGVDEWFSRVHPEDQQLLRDAINQHIEGKSPHFEAEYRIKRAHGDLAWVLSRGLVVRSQQGEAYRMAGSQTDITTRKLAEAQLVRDAMFDALTGLPNRTQFLERLDYAIEKAQSNPGYEFAVLFLDLDRFKKINDSCGHLVGDDLLIETARRLESCVQPKDIVARLAGDEFALLLDDIINRDYPSQIAERILKELAFPFSLGGKKIYISASVGIALNERHHAKAQQL